MIADSDRARAAFHARVAREDWTRAENYHLCVDAGGVVLERAAELIIGYLNNRAPRR